MLEFTIVKRNGSAYIDSREVLLPCSDDRK